MQSTLNLFKALPVENKESATNEELMQETIKKGFVFSPEVIANYPIEVLKEITIGLSPEELNSSFHKSWDKVRNASDEQLFLEQMVHYVTTYGFQSMGIYDNSSIYIPNEKLEIPELKDDLNLVVIKGLTKDELKGKLLKLLGGIALKEETMKDAVEIAIFVNFSEDDIEEIKNKEMKIMMYDYLNKVPSDPVEFLRYVIFKTTSKSLLIKSPGAVKEIKEANHLCIIKLFQEYDLEKLASIFYRYKPLFLAFRSQKELKRIINKVRRLAVKNHVPVKKSYLDTITEKLKAGETINEDTLKNELSKVNVFRKIRLAYALKFRDSNPDSIIYRIRNGKSWATDFNCDYDVKPTLAIILKSIADEIDVKDKKIYIPDYIDYALPTTEKQFTGYFPSGTSVKVDQDMIFGIHWNNVKKHTIDLDLSLIDQDGQKIGWDSSYRTDDRKILFSGDVVNAHKGASELFYISKALIQTAIMMVNYYNFDKDVEVPFDIIVANEKPSDLTMNYTVDPNKVLSIANSKIDTNQAILGLIVSDGEELKFYYAETSMGNSITSESNKNSQNTRKFLVDYYTNTISLKDVLIGAEFVSKEECEIDLSPEALEMDTIINLIQNNDISDKK